MLGSVVHFGVQFIQRLRTYFTGGVTVSSFWFGNLHAQVFQQSSSNHLNIHSGLCQIYPLLSIVYGLISFSARFFLSINYSLYLRCFKYTFKETFGYYYKPQLNYVNMLYNEYL